MQPAPADAEEVDGARADPRLVTVTWSEPADVGGARGRLVSAPCAGKVNVHHIMFSPEPSSWHDDSCANLAGVWDLPIPG